MEMENRSYISVSYQQKDHAKSLGALWDSGVKKWYIPLGLDGDSKMKLLEMYANIKTESITELVNEDREFGGNGLFVDLVPRSCWFTNVRYCIHPSDWNRLRVYIYSRVNYTCECCGINTKNKRIALEAHERWKYDESSSTQKLVRIVALCKPCHEVTHIGLASVRGRREEAIAHLKRVRLFTDEEADEHIQDAFKVWHDRSAIDWSLDLSLMTDNGIKLARSVNKDERRDICEKQLQQQLV
tara:strand:- start:468 stop:1193 length:726 start_codon:yes stop_codon:yes gene_type:complete